VQAADPVNDNSSSTSVRPWLRTAAMCVVLFVGTMILFSRALDGGFVNYDDPEYVTENARVQAGLTWDGVVWAFTAQTDGIRCFTQSPYTYKTRNRARALFGEGPQTYSRRGTLSR
jgi:hypothetical protein